MTAGLWRLAAMMAVALSVGPAVAQFTVLDQTQDGETAQTQETAPPPPICGTQPVTVAKMAWPSAELLAEIHVRLLRQEFGCDVSITPGDLAATGSSMGSTGQPAVAPEMWVTRIADVWNAGIEAQMLRPAASSYVESQFEGWFMPDYLAAEHPELRVASNLADGLSAVAAKEKLRFISCPVDWACAVINRNLITALGLTDLVELVEPANRFEMDTLIAEAVNLRQAVLLYYWQPNAVLAQLNFVPLDMGAYDQEAARCLAQVVCASPKPSAFASETVVVALAEWVFTDIPAIAAYFQRSSMPLEVMNGLLAKLSEPGATAEGVAERFVAGQETVWRAWVGAGAG